MATSQDDVYPVHLLDDTNFHRSLLMSYLFRFNDPLDAQKLHDSLSRLLEIGDWRKLGGRLRLKTDGKLEIYVPRPYTAQRPAIAFAHKTFDSSIEMHPVGRYLFKPLNGTSLTQQTHADFRSFAGWPDSPTTIMDLIRKKAPQISLHVTSFSNGTIVSLSWPHTLMDAAGLRALLRNWSLVLRGKEQSISSLACGRQDMLHQAELNNDGKREEMVIEKMRPGIIGLIVMMARILWYRLWKSTFEERTILLPGECFSHLRTLAEEDLTRQTADFHGQKPFISEGDVLAAWGAQIAASSHFRPRPVTVYSYLNARFRLQIFQQDRNREYVQNMVQVAYVTLSAQTARLPLGQVALLHRRQVAEQSTEQQTLSYFRMQREYVKSHNTIKLLFGDPRADPLIFNNLSKIDIFHAIDFSPAVIARNSTQHPSRMNPTGHIMYYHPLMLNNHTHISDALCALGKDHADNCWLVGSFRPRAWAKIERELDRLQQLSGLKIDKTRH